MNEISVISAGIVEPAIIKPRVEFAAPAAAILAVTKSPKSCAFPVDAMVTNSMLFIFDGV